MLYKSTTLHQSLPHLNSISGEPSNTNHFQSMETLNHIIDQNKKFVPASVFKAGLDERQRNLNLAYQDAQRLKMKSKWN